MAKSKRTLWQATLSLWEKMMGRKIIPDRPAPPPELAQHIRLSGRMEFSQDAVWVVDKIIHINRHINGGTHPIKCYEITSSSLSNELPEGTWLLWHFGPTEWVLTLRQSQDSGATIPWDNQESPKVLDALCHSTAKIHNGEDPKPFHRDLKNIHCDVEFWTRGSEQPIADKMSLWTYYRTDYDEMDHVINESLFVTLSGWYDEATKTIDGGDKILLFNTGEPLAEGSVLFY